MAATAIIRTKARAPRIRPAAKPARSLVALKLLGQLESREREILRWNSIVFFSGAAVVVAVPVFITWTAWSIRRGIASAQPVSFMTIYKFVVGATMILVYLVGSFTRKESRSETIDTFIREGVRPAPGQNDPFLRLILSILLAGILYGAFLTIDGIKTWWLLRRLRGVDRYRAAAILAHVSSEPTGVEPLVLLQLGENPLNLRRTLALLMALEFVDISPAGDCVILLSPARRALRQSWDLL